LEELKRGERRLTTHAADRVKDQVSKKKKRTRPVQRKKKGVSRKTNGFEPAKKSEREQQLWYKTDRSIRAANPPACGDQTLGHRGERAVSIKKKTTWDDWTKRRGESKKLNEQGNRRGGRMRGSAKKRNSKPYFRYTWEKRTKNWPGKTKRKHNRGARARRTRSSSLKIWSGLSLDPGGGGKEEGREDYKKVTLSQGTEERLTTSLQKLTMGRRGGSRDGGREVFTAEKQNQRGPG